MYLDNHTENKWRATKEEERQANRCFIIKQIEMSTNTEAIRLPTQFGTTKFFNNYRTPKIILNYQYNL